MISGLVWTPWLTFFVVIVFSIASACDEQQGARRRDHSLHALQARGGGLLVLV
jgi:hypothetical protein